MRRLWTLTLVIGLIALAACSADPDSPGPASPSLPAEGVQPDDVLVAPGAVAEGDGVTLQVAGSGWSTGPTTGEEFSGTFHIRVRSSLQRPIRVRANEQVAEMADGTAYEAVDVLLVPSGRLPGPDGIAEREGAAQSVVIPPRKQRYIEIPFSLADSGEPLPVPELVVFTIGESRFVVEDPLG